MTMKRTCLLALGLLVAVCGCSQQRTGKAVTQNTTVAKPAAVASNAPTAQAPVPQAPTDVTASPAAVSGEPTTVSPFPKIPKDATGYALGVQMARGFMKQKIEADADAMARGMKDAAAGKEPAEGAQAGPGGSATASLSMVPSPSGKAGYVAGFGVAKGLIAQGAELNWDLVAKGLKDVLDGNKLIMPDDMIASVLQTFTADLIIKRRINYNIQAADNKKVSEEFLAANKTKEGVVTLPSGLQYKVIKMGDGPKPTKTDTVEVHYRGMGINGTEFVNTYAAKKPAVFNLTTDPMIAGLKEALKLMPVGSKWQLFIPARLGYLWRGVGRLVGPNSALIYEVELLAIK